MAVTFAGTVGGSAFVTGFTPKTRFAVSTTSALTPLFFDNRGSLLKPMGFGVPFTIPSFATTTPQDPLTTGLDASFPIVPVIDSTAVTKAVSVTPGVGLIGTPGNDLLTGGAGSDAIDGHEGRDTIFGAAGSDTVLGNLGDDLLHGGRGGDVLAGGAGSDVLWGDRGDDTLVGGLGADVFAFAPGSGHDRIEDFNPAEGDRLLFDAGMPFTLGVSGFGDAVITFSPRDEITLAGIQLEQLGPALLLVP